MKNSPPVHGGRFLSQNQFGRPAREHARNTPVRDLSLARPTAGSFSCGARYRDLSKKFKIYRHINGAG